MSRTPVTTSRPQQEPRGDEPSRPDASLADLRDADDPARSDRMRAFARQMMRRFPRISDYLARN